MNIVVDFGNTITKVGIFKDEILEEIQFFKTAEDLRVFLGSRPGEHLLVSSVSHPATEILSWSAVNGNKIALTAALPLPIRNGYATPATLGVDRIAAVCGAYQICPGEDCLVIDAGTCITYEFLDASGTYLGGSISPGVTMRFAAMHQFTARLPLIAAADHPPLTGNTTEMCMQSGVVYGMKAEVEGIVSRYREQYPDIRVFLCGGDAHHFETPGIALVPELVLTGLNRILRHNIST